MSQTISSKRVYRNTDKELKVMYRRMAAEFSNMALVADWDALNVISVTSKVDELYSRLYDYLKVHYLNIARRAYKDAWVGKPEDEEEVDDLFIIALLDRYDPKTEYQYSHEWGRKRDRLKEAVMSTSDVAPNSQMLREVIRRALKLLERQVGWMGDTVTDEARNKAFEDAGVEKVRWNTQEDERVCSVCRERNYKVYEIRHLPAKHPNCRCYFTPVT